MGTGYSYQRTKKKRQEKQRRDLVYVIGMLLVLIALIGSGFRLYKFFTTRQLPRKGQIIIGFESLPLAIVSFVPSQKTLVFLLIPERTLIDAVHGYGQYRVEAFNELERINEESFLLSESLIYQLGLPIDGWVKSAPPLPAQLAARELKKWYRRAIWTAFKKESETNLAAFDLAKIWWFVYAVRNADVKVISLEQEKSLDEAIFPDGSLFYKVDQEKGDLLLKKYFIDDEIKKEKLTIGVANATNSPGLAKKIGRIINNFGGTLVKLGDWSQNLNGCEIRVKSTNGGYTSEKLARVLDCPIREGDFGSFMVDVLVVVGQDFCEKVSCE
ncbi:MAG TPA: LytR C-terminal domain-containing protein [Candidatus Bathyarchaeia archaeon]|nr:LytR C-terminal domain-containing protein [Candidatus Bathyarchaeia archaeon]